jgi:DNA-binding transcriptional regulator YhcF (GntR family)
MLCLRRLCLQPRRTPLSDSADLSTADMSLGPIEQMPLRVQVAERLRSAIVTGKLRPGTPLVETALAEQLHVSRAPIREAIQDLENDGLVETMAYRRKRVKPLTVQEVAEICEMRQLFEVMAVRRILNQGTVVESLWAPSNAHPALRSSIAGSTVGGAVPPYPPDHVPSERPRGRPGRHRENASSHCECA